MLRTFNVALCCAVVSLACVEANAVTLSSSNFELGFGASINTTASNPGAWTTTETNATNTPVTAGNANATSLAISPGFTLTPTVRGRNFSSGGPSFVGGVLAGTSATSAWSNPFEVTVAGTYSGTLPTWATNVRTTVNISQISIYAVAYNGSPYSADVNNFHFNETTAGNLASSLNAPTLFSTTSTTVTPSNYQQLVWNPNELAIGGLSAARSFNVTGFGDGSMAYMIDGLEIFGTIEVSYDFPAPEPSSLSLLGLGLLGLTQLRRRARGAVQ